MRNSKRIKHMIQLTMLLSLGVIFHYVESFIELPAIPGVRLGFANIIGLICLYMFGTDDMVQINIGRVVFGSLLSGRIFSTSFYLSLSGVLLCSLVSAIAYKKTALSIFGVSILSSVMHGVGQILCVMYIYNTVNMIYYLPILMVCAIPTGLFTGYVAYLVLKHLKKGIKQ